MITTPLAPRVPYIAVDEASFRTSIDAISEALISSVEPYSIPSTRNSGVFDAFTERFPLRSY